MWPFTRREDWEKTPEELNADVQRIAAAGRADVQRQLGATEAGANMTAQGRELWLGTPPDQRADLGLPPGSAPAVDYANTRAPGSTVASIPNTPPPAAQGAMGGKPPPALSNAERSGAGSSSGGMMTQLLGNANQMTFKKNDQGQIVQVTKYIHDLGPVPGTGSGKSPGPVHIDSTPESVFNTLLNNPPAGGVSPVSGMPPGSVPTSLPANPPSRSITDTQLDAAVQREKQYNADQAARTEEWNRTMAANRTPSGMTNQEAQRQKDKAARDQLQREQIAASKEIAKSQSEALAARYSIPAEARVKSAEIGAENKLAIADKKTQSDLVIKELTNAGQIAVANTYAVMNKDKGQLASDTDLAVEQLKNEGKIEAAKILSANRTKIDPMIWMTASDDQKSQILKQIGQPATTQSTGTVAPAAGGTTAPLATAPSYPDEASARAAGKKSGDVVMVGGKKFRLN